jgi:hypothetical protein
VPSISSQRPVSLRYHLWASVLAIVLVIIVPTRADPDLWGHIRFGLDWLRSHHIPSVDIYSFTHDQPYVDHEWLGEVVVAAAYSKAGALGLVALKSAIVLAALAIVAWRLRGTSAFVAAGVVLLAAASALPIVATARPQVTSILGLTLVLTLADSAIPYARRVASLAIVFAIWANLHGGWITGFGALGVYTGVQWLRSRTTMSRAIGILAIPFAATLANAYGVGLWRFMALTVRTARPDITEWQPIGLHEPWIMWLAVFFPISLLLMVSVRRESRPSPEIAASIVLLIVAGLRVSRVAPLIGPATAAALGPSFGALKPRTAQTSSRAGAVVLALPVIVLWVASVPWIARAVRCIPIRDTWAPDLQAARYLAGATGKLWIAFDWGEYAFWHFGPALRVSIDGRREAVYSDRVIQMHRQFDVGAPEARAEFLELSPDYVWLRRNSATEAWLSTHGYRMLATTDASFVASRLDVNPPTAEPVAQPPAPACFP